MTQKLKHYLIQITKKKGKFILSYIQTTNEMTETEQLPHTNYTKEREIQITLYTNFKREMGIKLPPDYIK